MSELAIPTQPEAVFLEYVEQEHAAEEAHSWKHKLGQIAGRALLVLGIATGSTATVEAVSPSEAQAYTVKYIGKCSGWLFQQTCLNLKMGEKDHEKHREWVEDVTLGSPDAGRGVLEVWGDGFYGRTEGGETDELWHVGKWVADGTYICGRATDFSGFEQEVCMGIKV